MSRPRKSTSAEVAAVACRAYAAGLPMTQAVAECFGYSTNATARARIREARNAGFDIPVVGRTSVAPPKVKSVPVHKLRVVCDDCELEFAVDRLADLNRHCLEVHGRHPFVDERTPRPRREVAA